MKSASSRKPEVCKTSRILEKATSKKFDLTFYTYSVMADDGKLG